MNPYTTFFAAYNASVQRGNPYSRAEIIKDFTGGRTASLKDLSGFELDELTRQINTMSKPSGQLAKKPVPGGEKAERMRKGIIAIFHKMNRPPSDAIAWAEKQGVKGEKKKFNAYTTGELYVLLGVADKILEDWRKAIRNRMEMIKDVK